jgi:excisionase family DNA binding protein
MTTRPDWWLAADRVIWVCPHCAAPLRKPLSPLSRREVNPLRRKYLTSNQTAQRLAVSPKTIARWAKQGLLPHLRTLGGHRRYDPEMVDQLRRQLTHQP